MILEHTGAHSGHLETCGPHEVAHLSTHVKDYAHSSALDDTRAHWSTLEHTRDTRAHSNFAGTPDKDVAHSSTLA
jgi:hypothetical protein